MNFLKMNMLGTRNNCVDVLDHSTSSPVDFSAIFHQTGDNWNPKLQIMSGSVVGNLLLWNWKYISIFENHVLIVNVARFLGQFPEITSSWPSVKRKGLSHFWIIVDNCISRNRWTHRKEDSQEITCYNIAALMILWKKCYVAKAGLILICPCQ